MNKLALISLALVSATAFADKPTTLKGWVGDAKCGVKCASADHKSCATHCLSTGGTYVFVLDKDKKTIYTIDNPKAVKGHEGDLITVTGTIKGKKLHITKVK